MINARQLEVLCAVIEVGTTAKAAELLAVSQPAISNMIRHTEAQVGFALFARERGRLVPTPEALHIAQEAQHLFMQQRRVATIIEELRGGTTGRLSIVATPSIGQGILPHALAEFLKTRPKLNVSLDLGHVDHIANRLVSGRAELGLSITAPRHSALTVRPIFEGQMVCVCPQDHEMALSRTIRIADLNHVRHISYAANTPLGQMIDAAFSKRGLERRYFFEVRHTMAALDMVAAGLGVALVDGFALVGRNLGSVVVRPIDPPIALNMHSSMSNLFPTSNIAYQFQVFFRDFVANHSLPQAGGVPDMV
ncbi:MAG: LysR family transcriptional regulator [Roseovarius sp.]|nr:LysR family transcriptional regulator [Roseovarius sp.]